jgi:hypothetical protein
MTRAPQLGRKRVLAFAVGLWMALPLFVATVVSSPGCSRHAPEAQAPSAEPRQELPPVTFDFGAVFGDDTPEISHDFAIQNETGELLTLRKVRCSCTCTSSDLPAEELQPGAKTMFTIRANLLGRDGAQRFYCVLADQKGTERSFEMTAVVRQHFGFVPSVARFDECDPNAEFKQSVEFRQHAKTEAELPQLGVWPKGDEGLTVRPGQPRIERNQDGTVTRISPLELRVIAGALAGTHTTAVLAPFRVPESSPAQYLYVSWTVRNLYEIDPVRVVFAAPANLGEPEKRRVTICRADGRALRVVSCRASEGSLNVATSTEDAGKTVVLSLARKQITSAEPVWGEVELRTNHPAQPQVIIPYAMLSRKKNNGS